MCCCRIYGRQAFGAVGAGPFYEVVQLLEPGEGRRQPEVAASPAGILVILQPDAEKHTCLVEVDSHSLKAPASVIRNKD